MSDHALPAPHLLVVEDDPGIRNLLLRYFSHAGYLVSTAVTLTEVRHYIENSEISIILLDLMLPQESGYEVCRYIHQTTNAPIIMVTALAEIQDKIAGLNLGADDYISKPFDLAELEARVRAVLRRGDRPRKPSSLPDEYVFGPWKFVPAKRALYRASGVRLTLSGAETDLMLVFWQHQNTLLTRPDIINLIHGNPTALEERSIDLLVSRLRRKLAEGGRQLELIRTVRGDGYIFDPRVCIP
ncbi:response regulator transcription factor [Acetobacter conturbans]|uniref:Response regulator n=1 Tax=Acetobacter conturbans TaxID=1737472 RepID=A0ABX0K6D7_9PROT|nr:response regulator transcription factor [Acetobacter conturbans]NHN89512.1 response regulator [Acetobacter conturbans]